MPLIIGFNQGTGNINALEQRVEALEHVSPTNGVDGQNADQTLLLRILYAHCGGDIDTATMQQPAILRGAPTALTPEQTPRFIVFHNGYLYDNAPADYRGGEYI